MNTSMEELNSRINIVLAERNGLYKDICEKSINTFFEMCLKDETPAETLRVELGMATKSKMMVVTTIFFLLVGKLAQREVEHGEKITPHMAATITFLMKALVEILTIKDEPQEFSELVSKALGLKVAVVKGE